MHSLVFKYIVFPLKEILRNFFEMLGQPVPDQKNANLTQI